MILNVVLIAAGGGNDTFSIIPLAKHFINKGKRVSIFGVVGFTPFHTNMNPIMNPKLTPNLTEKPIMNPYNLRRFMTYIDTNNDGTNIKEIKNNECLVPEVVKKLELHVDKYLVISPKYQPKYISNKIDEILSELSYKPCETSIIVADFGGDILTDGISTTFSPGLDSFSLQVANYMNHNYKKEVFLCFPGVDGELPPSYMRDIVTNLSTRTIPIDKKLWKSSLVSIFDIIGKRRPGNTIPNMLKIIDNKEVTSFKKRLIVRKTSIIKEYDLDIDYDLCENIHVFSLIDVIKLNPFSRIKYTDLLHMFTKIHSIYKSHDNSKYDFDKYESHICTDFNLQYIVMDSQNKYTSINLNNDRTVIQIAVFPESYKKEDIMNIIPEIILNLTTKTVNSLLFDKDQFLKYNLSDYLSDNIDADYIDTETETKSYYDDYILVRLKSDI